MIPLLVLALAQGVTLVVSPAGPLRSVEEAVQKAPVGSTVLIRAGTYDVGPLVLDRRITLAGEGQPTLRGRGDHTIIRITADSVEVRGLVLERVASSFVEDRAALKVDNAQACVLEDLEIRDAFFGIYLAKARGCALRRNRVLGGNREESEAGNAIHLWDTRDVEISDNTVSGHRDGFYFEFVRGARVNGNTSTANRRYGLHFMFSDSCTYRRNVFRANGAGVAVMYTKRLEIDGNRFEANNGPTAYGLLLKEITDSRIANNTFRENTVGLLTEGGGRLEVLGNAFQQNGWAIRLLANSMGNRFEGNAFAGNSFDVGTNSKSNYSTFAGNWWDRYRGYDLDRDGRGDTGFRPVRLFGMIVTRHETATVLLRSAFVDLLDQAERVLPVFTPETLVDTAPLMVRPR
jgi:nitrous oxidase accessory protein